jgi:hypothetical protein
MKMRRIISLIIIVILSGLTSVGNAQCAMCRTQLENNVSNGEPGIAAGINTGILYLLSMPYLIILSLIYFWYKSSKKNANTQLPGSIAAR